MQKKPNPVTISYTLAVSLAVLGTFGIGYFDARYWWLTAILSGSPFLLLAWAIKRTQRNGFTIPIKSWQWPLYTLGWLAGIYTLVFWIVLYSKHLFFREKHFFDEKFHRRVFKSGILALIAIIAGLTAFQLFEGFASWIINFIK